MRKILGFLCFLVVAAGCEQTTKPSKREFVRPESHPLAATDPTFQTLIDQFLAEKPLRKATPEEIAAAGCDNLTLKWQTTQLTVTEGETVTAYATIDVAEDEMGFQRVGLSYDSGGVGIVSADATDGDFDITNNYSGYGPCEYIGLVVGPVSNTFQLFDHSATPTFTFVFEGLAEGVYYVQYEPSASSWALCGQQLVMDTNGDDDSDCIVCDDDDTQGTGGDGGFALGTGSSGNRLKITVLGLER